MNRTIRLPLAIIFLALLFFVPLMVQTVLSADPTPTPGAMDDGGDKEFPLVPTPTGPQLEMRTMGVIEDPGDPPGSEEIPPALQELNISQQPLGDHLPHAVYNPDLDQYLVIWQDRTDSGPTDLFGRYLDHTGQPLSDTFRIVENRPGFVQVKVSYGGGSYLLVWREGEDRYQGALYSLLIPGSVGDPPQLGSPVLIREPVMDDFEVIFDPLTPGFLVFWLDDRNPFLEYTLRGEIYAFRISLEGDLIGNELKLLALEDHLGSDVIDKILNAPSASGELSAAYNPVDNQYLIVFSNYECSTLLCLFGEDVRAARFQADTLELIQSPFIVERARDIQWMARVVYQPRTNQFLVVWADNHEYYQEFDLYGEILSGDGSAIYGSHTFPLVRDPGSQELPRVAVVPDPGDGREAAFVLTWEQKAQGVDPSQVFFQYLNEEGQPIGKSLIPSFLPYRTRANPDVVVSSGSDPQSLVVWTDILPGVDSDIHGMLISTSDTPGVSLVSPLNFTMPFSLRPTLRWESVFGAERYSVTIYHWSENGDPPEVIMETHYLDPEDTRVPDNLEMHEYRFEDNLPIGPTKEESLFLWQVEAVGEFSHSLGTSLYGEFQIPPLGLAPVVEDIPSTEFDESTRYDHWNDFDAQIYHWSEQRDLPPNIYKAVLASESGDMHKWFEIGPEWGYLYEAKHDAANCVAHGSAANNYCDNYETFYKYFEPFFLVDNFQPEIYPGDNRSLPNANPSIPRMVGDYRFSYVTNWRALAKYTGCPEIEPSSESYDLYQCLYDWFDDPSRKAEYRVMAGYGLSGINYWTNVPLLYPNAPDDPVIYNPESLYQADLNIQLGTQILGNKRCWWHNAAGSHLPFLDPASEVHQYLSAEDYKVEDFIAWRQVIASYAGFGFGYPIKYLPGLQIKRVDYRLYGITDEGKDYIDTYPVDMSGYAELGIEVDVQIEESPQQYSQDKTYGDAERDDTWDREPKRCPYPGYDEVSQTSPDPGSQGGFLFSTTNQTDPGTILGETEVDFQGDSDPETVQLAWMGTPGNHLYHDGAVRIFEDADLTNLIWESPPLDGVKQFGSGQAVDLPGSEQQLFVVEFAVSAHSTKSYFVAWEGDHYAFLEFEDALGEISDHLVSTGGGAFLQPDGSIALMNRGWNPAQQTDVTVFAWQEDHYIQERTYTYDETVTDTTPPDTYLIFLTITYYYPWLSEDPRIGFRSYDDTGVDYMEYSLSGVDTGETQRVYLAETIVPLTEGWWTARYNAVDIYGNVGTERTFSFGVDTTPPSTAVILDGYFDPDQGGFLSEVEILAVCEDPPLADGTDGAGLLYFEFSLDEGSTWNRFADSLTFEEPGDYLAWFRCRDRAGNESEPVVEIFTILTHGITIQSLSDAFLEEGEELTVNATFQDLDLDAVVSGFFHWGDGSPDTPAEINLVSEGTYQAAENHWYQDDGDFQAYLEVSNDHGVTAREYFTVAVTNLPPVVEAGEDVTAGPGEPISFNGFFTDPGGLDTHTIQWRFGDGTTAEGTLTPTHSYDAIGTYEVILQVDDDDGDNGSDILLVTITNQPPTVELGDDATINEGDTFSREGNFSDPGSASWTGEVDYGAGEGYRPLDLTPEGTFLLEQVYLDDGIYTVTVLITDEEGLTGEASFQVIVNNIAPEVTLTGESSLSEGETFTGGGSFIDPGADSWTATVDYDDGQGPEPLVLTEQTFTLEHLYPEDGIPAVTVCVTDDDGGEGCAVLTLTVENTPPSVAAGEDMTAETGEDVVFSGSYSDPGVEDTHTISWDFGDGETEGGNLTPTHVYSTPGTYTVTLTVTDDEGAAGSGSLTVVITQSQPENLIVLNDWRSDNCLALDLETGAYSWYADGGEVYTGTLTLVERGQVVLLRSVPDDPQYLRGLLLLRPEMGIARMRVGGWFRGGWMFILDRDFTEPTVCQ